jgi:hypothetical protein
VRDLVVRAGRCLQIRDDARDVVFETAEKISPLGLANSAAVLHAAGTVILSRTASVGFVAQMGIDMAVTQDFMTWTCGPRLVPEYLMHALRATRPEILQRVQGSTHKSPWRFSQLPNDPRHIATNLRAYIEDYSQYAKAVFANFSANPSWHDPRTSHAS